MLQCYICLSAFQQTKSCFLSALLTRFESNLLNELVRRLVKRIEMVCDSA